MKQSKIRFMKPVVAITVLSSLASLPPGFGDGDGPAAAAVSSIGYAGTVLIQLRVSDLDRSIRFYRDTLDLRLQLRNEDLRWAKFDVGIAGVTIGFGEGPEAAGSGTASINLGVADIESARRTLESRGVSFAGPTITIPGVVKLADFADPDGNRLRLAEAL